VLSLGLCAVALGLTPASSGASTLIGTSAFFDLSVRSADGACTGPGECLAVDAGVSPGQVEDVLLFDLHVAWDPSYWDLQDLVWNGGLDVFGAIDRDDMLGSIGDLFGDVGLGDPLATGETLVSFLFEVVGYAQPARDVFSIGDLSFPRAVLIAESDFDVIAPGTDHLATPEPGSGVLAAVGLAALAAARRRRRRASGRSSRGTRRRLPIAASMLSLLALGAGPCSQGEQVAGQRTFLWHQGDASTTPLPHDVANPFRGRVVPNAIGDRIEVQGGFFDRMATSYDGFRFYEGARFDAPVADPILRDALADGFTPTRLDSRDEFIEFIQMAPDDVVLDVGIGLFRDIVPDVFGGDFSGVVPCVDPRDNQSGSIPSDDGVARQVLESTGAPPPGSFCVRGAHRIGEPKGSYQRGSITRLTGGDGENPFRPGPDLASLGGDLAEAARRAGVPVDAVAQGLFTPSRGMQLGLAMDFERNVDPASGRPLPARLAGGAIASCADSGEVAPDHLHGATQGPGVLAYDSSYASHPLSMTPGAALVTQRISSPGTDEPFIAQSIEIFRGGIGRDPGCLRPGGAPGEPGAFRFDTGLLQQTNALYNHHANQGVFASLCNSTYQRWATFDPPSCQWTFFSSPKFLDDVGVPTPLGELTAAVAAGDQNGNTQGILVRVDDTLKVSDPNLPPLPPVPFKSTNALFNDPRVICPAGATRLTRTGDGAEVCAVDLGGDLQDPGNLQTPTTAPFDRNNNGSVDVAGCADEDPATPCDLGGFDGVRTLTDEIMRGLIPAAANIDTITLDQSLTNEQRALLGCGPFWGTRCDTSVDSVLDRNGTDDPNDDAIVQLTLEGSRVYGRFGGIDFLNGEASAMFEAVASPDTTAPSIGREPQPGTVGADASRICMRSDGVGGMQRLPGCRGIESVQVSAANPSSPNPDFSVVVEFEPGYLPSVDGCIIGSRIRRSNGELVNVTVLGGAPGMADEIELCNQASTSQIVPGDALVEKTCPIGDAGVPDSGTGTRSVCDARRVTLEELPLIHPLAGCIDSQAHVGTGDCESWFDRDLVDEFLGAPGACVDSGGNPLPVGTPCAQLFRSELAAFSWNLQMFMAVVSCDKVSQDAEGLNHSGVPPNPSLLDDPECFVSNEAHAADRCSYVSPHRCREVKAFLSVAPPLPADGGAPVDADRDGIPDDGDRSGTAGDVACRTGESFDCDDNCADVANRSQVNSNALDETSSDDFGNACDPDLDDDGDIDATDRNLQLTCFSGGSVAGFLCEDADLVGAALDSDPEVRVECLLPPQLDPGLLPCEDGDFENVNVDGFDRLQLLRWLRDPTSAPGRLPSG
jgi:hypothetical protein